MRPLRLEILTEERSMKVFLEGLLPKVLPESYKLGENCFIYDHSGKTDLQKRLRNRVRAYRHYPAEVILLVVHDQDANDCKKLKQELVELIQNENPKLKFSVRIACRELENWYLGDLESVEQVYPRSGAGKLKEKAKYRNPDRLNGSEEMKRFSKEFGKVSCARAMGPIISQQENKSPSFNHLITGLKKLLS